MATRPGRPAAPQAGTQTAHLFGKPAERPQRRVILHPEPPEPAAGHLRDQRQASQTKPPHVLAAAQAGVGQFLQIDDEQPEQQPERGRGGEHGAGARKTRPIRRQRQRDLPRIDGLHRRALRRLLDAGQHRGEQRARRIGITLLRIQWDLRQLAVIDAGLRGSQIGLQRRHTVARHPHLGLGRGDHATGFRRNVPLHLLDLPAQRQHVRMVRPQPRGQPLQLRGQCAVLLTQGDHARRHRRQRSGAGAVARGIQSALGVGQVGAGPREVLGELADLLGVQPGMDALHQALAGAVGGDPVFLVAHFGAQLDRPRLQPDPRLVHRVEFRRELRLDVRVHQVVDDRRGEHRVLGGERHFHHVGGVHRAHRRPPAAWSATRYPRMKRAAAQGQRDGDGVGGAMGVEPALQPAQQAGPPGWRAQRRVERRIGEQIELMGHRFQQPQTAQHLRLARHDSFGGRIDLQDALQLSRFEIIRIVDQRSGRGVAVASPASARPRPAPGSAARRRSAAACGGAGCRTAPVHRVPGEFEPAALLSAATAEWGRVRRFGWRFEHRAPIARNCRRAPWSFWPAERRRASCRDGD